MTSYKEKFQNVKALVFDVDGVFTDGSVILDHNGDLQRIMNTKDGFIVKYAIDMGIDVAIISGGKSNAVLRRFMDLGLEDVYLGVKGVFSPEFKAKICPNADEASTANEVTKCKEANKMDTLRKFCDKKGIDLKTQVLYMGDDIPDLEVLSNVYLSTCPNDAVTEVQNVADYISQYPGGKGCVRDVVEQVLRAQDKWLSNTASIK
jgi:3-deoxy-D-manno-octulosonate 8-phosphate phosphatase (KDO 8-P phosphatase)